MNGIRRLLRPKSETSLSSFSNGILDEMGSGEVMYAIPGAVGQQRLRELEDENVAMQDEQDEELARRERRKDWESPPVVMWINPDGIHGMKFSHNSRRAFVHCDEEGPVYVVNWGLDTEEQLDPEDKEDLWDIAMDAWEELEVTPQGRSWIRQARIRKQEAEWNNSHPQPQDPYSPTYLAKRSSHAPPTNTRRVHNVIGAGGVEVSDQQDGTTTETVVEMNPDIPGLPATADTPVTNTTPAAPGESPTQTSSKQVTPWRAARKGAGLMKIWDDRLEAGPGTNYFGPTDEEMVEHVWKSSMNQLHLEPMRTWMAQAMIAPVPDGPTDEFEAFTWKLTRELSTKNKTVDYITRWLNASALNGIPPFAELYLKYENTGDLKKLEGLSKCLDDIGEGLKIGKKPDLDSSLTQYPGVGHLQDTVGKINSEIETESILSSDSEYKKQMSPFRGSEWKKDSEEPVLTALSEEKKRRMKLEKEFEKLKKQVTSVLVEQTYEDNKQNVQDAMEKIQLEKWRREAEAQEEQVRQSRLAASLQKEQQQAVVQDLNTDITNLKKERANVMAQLSQRDKTIEQLRQRELTLRNHEFTNGGTDAFGTIQDPSKGIGSLDPGKVINGAYGDNDPHQVPGSEAVFKRNGRSYGLTNYAVNVSMRKFDELPKIGNWWKNILNNLPKCPETGVPMIPPIIRGSLIEVENPQLHIIKMMQNNVKESTDLHFNLAETAKLVLKQGIHHDLLSPLFCDYILPMKERSLVTTIKNCTSDLSVLLDYINGKTNRLTGTEERENEAKNFLNKELMKKSPDIRVTVGRLKDHYALEVVRTYHNYDNMTPQEVEAHKETLSRVWFTNELKLNHKLSWDEAIKHGYNNNFVSEIAEKMQGIFHINAQNKKVYTTTKADKRAGKAPTRKSESRSSGKAQKKRVNNAMSGDTYQRQEQRPPRNTSDAKTGRKREFKRESRREFKMDTSTLRRIAGSTDKMWDSKDGKVTNIRLPCGYHKQLGMTPEECLDSLPRHCYECSKPNKIAPPVRECKGRHQYRTPAPRRRGEGRRQ